MTLSFLGSSLSLLLSELRLGTHVITTTDHLAVGPDIAHFPSPKCTGDSCTIYLRHRNISRGLEFCKAVLIARKATLVAWLVLEQAGQENLNPVIHSMLQ